MQDLVLYSTAVLTLPNPTVPTFTLTSIVTHDLYSKGCCIRIRTDSRALAVMSKRPRRPEVDNTRCFACSVSGDIHSPLD